MTKLAVGLNLLSALLWGGSTFINIPAGIGADPRPAFQWIGYINAAAAACMAGATLLQVAGRKRS